MGKVFNGVALAGVVMLAGCGTVDAVEAHETARHGSAQPSDGSTRRSPPGTEEPASVVDNKARPTSAVRSDSEPAVSAAGDTVVRGTNLCASGEHVLFSCEIAGRGMRASLCTSPHVRNDSGYMYYVYGTHRRIEMHFPARRAAPDGNFARTHLTFAGNSGGYAYSFVNAGTKYILYSISGSMGMERHGLLALDGAERIQHELKCEPGSLVEDDADVLQALTRELAPDAAIERQGLPLAR